MQLVILAISSVGFAMGSYFLKRFAEGGVSLDLVLTVLAYVVGNAAYMRLLMQGAVQTGVITAMAHIILMSLMGVLAFDERLGGRQVAGIMLALVAVWLFSGSPARTTAS